MAKLYFYYSAMNAGKSTALLQSAHNYRERGMRALILAPAMQARDGVAGVSSRIGLHAPALAFGREDDLLALGRADIERAGRLHCVLVDESQFLEPAQIDDLFRIAKHDGVSVICYGLRSDFRTAMFPGASRLFELADNIEKLPTMCRCGSQAEFNCRLVDGRHVFTGEQVAIDDGVEVSYESLCGPCFMREQDAEGAHVIGPVRD